MILHFITEEYLFRYITPANIFERYAGENKGKIRCIFHDEKTPSLFLNPEKNLFKCFGCGEWGSAVQFVMQKYGLSYNNALILIAKDFNIISDSNIEVKPKELPTPFIPKETTKKQFFIKSKSFTEKNLAYWLQYNININLLNLYNVEAIDILWLENDVIYLYNEKNPAFNYTFKDGYKIYFPLSPSKKRRFLGNSSYIQGYDQLDKTGDLVIITKSLKDVMFFRSMELNAVSPQAEENNLSESLILELKARFKKVLINYDNDSTGIRKRTEECEKYNLDFLQVPDELLSKDYTDLCIKIGIQKTINLIRTQLTDK